MSTSTLVLVVGLLLGMPSLLFAAFNDATFTTDTVIQLGSTNLNVSGSSAVLESLTVNDSDFTATFSPGSSLAITSADKKTFTTSASATGVNVNGICESGSSSLTMVYPTGSGSAITVTVTPSGTCDPAPSTSTGTGSGSSSGVGGGGSSSTATTTTAAKPVATTTIPAITKPSPVETTTTPAGTMATPASPGTRVVVGASSGFVFTQSLTKGSRSPQVLALQRILNSDPDTLIALTGAGSPGNETTLIGPLTIKAVKKFQLKYKIAKEGDYGYGFVGPRTRAKLNEIAQGGSSAPVSIPTLVPSAADTTREAQLQQISLLMKMIAELQAQLKPLQGQ